MFTGIISDMGEILSIDKIGDTSFKIATSYNIEKIDLGASIACSGVCLTVTNKGINDDGQNWFYVAASNETINLTTLSIWKIGDRINLERALKIGDELGGHMVLGHVDGMAEVISRNKQGDSIVYDFILPKEYKRFIAPKGSIVLDGVSLTINKVDGKKISVNIISHTALNTNLNILKIGDKVNFEIDALARYVARLLDDKDLKKDQHV